MDLCVGGGAQDSAVIAGRNERRFLTILGALSLGNSTDSKPPPRTLAPGNVGLSVFFGGESEDARAEGVQEGREVAVCVKHWSNWISNGCPARG